jgi:hypothetical protein
MVPTRGPDAYGYGYGYGYGGYGTNVPSKKRGDKRSGGERRGPAVETSATDPLI